MILFKHISKRYPNGHDALKSVSFELHEKEMAFLVGHSGAGKSTLLKLIMLQERASRGQGQVCQRDIVRLSRWRIPALRREIGVIFQDHRLLMDRTVFDNVALPLVVAGCRHQELPRRVHAALDKVKLLHKERSYPIMLSGGEQQRVGIARAIVNKPPLLLADEPTGNLDAALAGEVMDLFQEFNHHGVTTLIATHNLDQVRRLRKRVLQLKNGELVFDGLPPVADGKVGLS